MGMIEILLIAGLVYFGYRCCGAVKLSGAPAGYASPAVIAPADSSSYATTTMELPASRAIWIAASGTSDRWTRVRSEGSSARPRRTSSSGCRPPGAARDMGRANDVLTPEMQALLQKDCDRMRAEHRINRLENVAVREAEVTEAWQERGQDFVTVHFLASVLDYTTDEAGAVLEGSATQPVKFEEYWTFVRPVGPNPWRLRPSSKRLDWKSISEGDDGRLPSERCHPGRRLPAGARTASRAIEPR